MALKQGELVPQLFNHPEFGSVRIVDNNGELWFVGKDVAEKLGYSNPQKAIRDHVDAEDKRAERIVHPSGGAQETLIINEGGLYSLTVRSNMPKAKEFTRWLTHDVAISIRKHGVYMTAEAAEKILFNPDFIIGLAQQVKDAQAERDAALAQVAELKPKAEYTEAVLESDEHLTSELIAKEYGECAQWLHITLGKLGKIYKRGRTWYMRAQYAKEGYRTSETVILARGKTVVNHYWTQKGRQFIYYTLKNSGILPLIERDNPQMSLM